MTDYITLISLVVALGTILFWFKELLVKLFVKYGDSPKVIRNPLTYIVLGINFIFTTCLPLSLLFEFQPEAGSKYALFPFYCEYYPHIVIYPVLLFGFASLFVLRATLLRWSASKRDILMRIMIAILVAFIATYYEATGGYMMLLEFNVDAQAGVGRFNDLPVIEKAKALGIGQAFASSSQMAEQVSSALASADGKSEIAAVLNNYDAWEKLGENWKSYSRAAYLAMFYYMIFVIILGFSLLPPVRIPVDRVKEINSFTSLDMAGALIIFLMWMPFRMFYNLQTKIPIFGSRVTDNFLGPLPFFNMVGLLPSEVIPISFILTFLSFLVFRVADLSKPTLIVVVAIISFVIILGSASLAVLNPNAFAEIYGLDGNLKHLGFRLLLLSLLLLLTYDFISSKVDSVQRI